MEVLLIVNITLWFIYFVVKLYNQIRIGGIVFMRSYRRLHNLPIGHASLRIK
jgi:hypothetical protein